VKHDDRYENDTTSSRTVAERYRSQIHDDEGDASLALVHYRGGREEFDLGIEYSSSSDPLDRVTGSDILAQLGWEDRSFLDESVAALIRLLEDADENVVTASAVALGHRRDPSAIPQLLRLADHPNADIRLGVVHGLMRHSHPDAIRAMIRLSADSDHDVRNWATFGLGSQIEDDTPEIREALRVNLADPDYEIRGEAIVGLAERKDPQVPDILIREWESSETVSRLSIDAARVTASARLIEHLERFRTELTLEDDASFKSALDDALKACGRQAGAGPTGSPG
jgi:HEAT repeat protein